MPSERDKTKRWQFGLRQLLVVIALAALSIWWLTPYEKTIRGENVPQLYAKVRLRRTWNCRIRHCGKVALFYSTHY